MMDVLRIFLFIIIGISGGFAVGAGFVAFLIIFDVIPRLAQITRSYHRTRWFEWSVILGTLYWTMADFFDWKLRFYTLSTLIIGAFAGMFVGMLAAGLTEVTNVFPIMAKRLKIEGYIKWLLLSMILGKVIGSLVEWFLL